MLLQAAIERLTGDAELGGDASEVAAVRCQGALDRRPFEALEAASDGGGMEFIRNSLLGQTMEFGRSGGGSISVSCGGLESPRTLPFAPDGTRPGRIYFQTGYTGCLLWVDTQSGTSVALLTNASLTNRLDEWESFSEDVVMAMLRGLKKGP